jgi:hypothetical protein
MSLARAAARWTRLAHLEKSAAADHHAGTAAPPARFRLGTRLAAAALADTALVHHRQRHLALRPEDRLLEINFEIHPQVRAARRTVTRAAAAVEEVVKDAAATASRRHPWRP